MFTEPYSYRMVLYLLSGKALFMPRQRRLSYRNLTIIAQDPSVRDGKDNIIRAQVSVPEESLAKGPSGHRVIVVDYDASTSTLLKPLAGKALEEDAYAKASDDVLLNDPRFHSQNVYAIIMSTLVSFERALGRRVPWGFGSHQIKVAPHAFCELNAVYSPSAESLLFGYFPLIKAMKAKGKSGKAKKSTKYAFTCLSHDIVVHETSHALLDGLRNKYTNLSSPDQAAFHEGFSDVIALLSVFEYPSILGKVIDLGFPERHGRELIQSSAVTAKKLKDSGLFGLAEQMGDEIATARPGALRRSVLLKPSPRYYREEPDYLAPHRRGEILVAAIMQAFIDIWVHRISSLGELEDGYLSRARVIEEGNAIAARVKSMAIRALDYAPPVDLSFGDFLSALFTVDYELNSNDSAYQFRQRIMDSFKTFGITPSSTKGEEPGLWLREERELLYDGSHFESLQRDHHEVFRFIWDNRKSLGLSDLVRTKVISVRPSYRISSDGFILKETVAEFIQTYETTARHLGRIKLKAPEGMPKDHPLTIYGGGALIFSEFGELKYYIHNHLSSTQRQQDRLDHLWSYGRLRKGRSRTRDFIELHLHRAIDTLVSKEEW